MVEERKKERKKERRKQKLDRVYKLAVEQVYICLSVCRSVGCKGKRKTRTLGAFTSSSWQKKERQRRRRVRDLGIVTKKKKKSGDHTTRKEKEFDLEIGKKKDQDNCIALVLLCVQYVIIAALPL